MFEMRMTFHTQQSGHHHEQKQGKTVHKDNRETGGLMHVYSKPSAIAPHPRVCIKRRHNPNHRDPINSPQIAHMTVLTVVFTTTTSVL